MGFSFAQVLEVFGWVLRVTVQGSVLVGLIILIRWLLREKLSVRWRYWLWMLLLVRLVMPWAPGSSISVFNLVPLCGEQVAEDYVETRMGERLVKELPVGLDEETVAVEVERAAESVVDATMSPVISARGTESIWGVMKVLGVLWLAGAMLFTVYVGAVNLRFCLWVRGGPVLKSGGAFEVLEDCKRVMGVRRATGIIETRAVKGLALFGVVRPKLLVPRGMAESLSRDELRHVFLHELAHLKRGDVAINWLVTLLQIVHWFNPVIWYAFWRMRADREIACDVLALRCVGEGQSQQYGRTILKLLQLFYQSQRLPGMVGILETKTELKRRIVMIANFKKDSKKLKLQAVLLILLTACISLTDAQVQTRQEKIAELMDNAMAFQKQQRYGEAVGQLEGLLAIDPMNDQALILKDTLEDMIYFRKQSEVQSAYILPYTEELTYPKSTVEIAEKRKPEMAIGQDPADAAVYEQLETIVDLSQFTPEMPLGEAIEELKNSVAPRLMIIVLWRDLSDNADIERTTPINMDAISAVRLGTALKLLLMSVSSGFADLDYVVENGVITIATKESLPSKLETRVYDIFDLVDTALDPNTGKVASYNEDDANDIVQHIIDTVEPDSWYQAGGEGRIAIYKGYKLIVLQTREIHQKIEQLLGGIRASPGEQGKTKPAIEIESRFLMVSEDFLEDISLDANSIYNADGKFKPAIVESPASAISETYSFILDDPNVSFLLRATKAHEDSTALTAPKVTVFDGEEAAFSIHRQVNYIYISGYTEPNRPSGEPEPKRDFVKIGTWWKVTPKITPDNIHILLDVDFELSELLGFEEHMYKEKYPYKIPQMEVVSAKTRVSVPNGGTVLMGGQKVTAEEDGRKVQRELLVLIKAKKVDSESRGTYRSGYGGYGGYGGGMGGMGGYGGGMMGGMGMIGGGMGGYGGGGYGGSGEPLGDGGGYGGYGGGYGGYGGGYGGGYRRAERPEDTNSPDAKSPENRP